MHTSRTCPVLPLRKVAMLLIEREAKLSDTFELFILADLLPPCPLLHIAVY